MNNILIVGNSQTLLEKNNGKRIDAFDYVVRMGDSPRIRGYEQYVGTKTDMFRMKWFNYFNVDICTGDINFGKPRTSFEFEYRDILCISQDPDYFTETATSFNRYVTDSLNRSFYYHIGNRYLHDVAIKNFNLTTKKWYVFNADDMQDLVVNMNNYSTKVNYTNGIEPSGGLCTIWFFIKNYPKSNITITGFDGWASGHYWKPNKIPFFSSHSGVYETMFIKQLIKKGRLFIL